MFTIYLIRNRLNGKVYVGQTKRSVSIRWSSHKTDARRGIKFPIYHAIRKYGEESFEVVGIATADTQEWIDYLEKLYILLYDSTNSEKGYNIRAGGNTAPIPQSTKDGLRRSRVGSHHSEEAKQRMSEGVKRAWAEGRNSGFPTTEATKQKLHDMFLGNKSCRWNHKLNDELLVFLYNNLVTIEKLAKHFDVNPKTIMIHLKATGLPLRYGHKRIEKEIDEELLKKMFYEGATINKIGRTLGIQWLAISKRIESLGLTREETKAA